MYSVAYNRIKFCIVLGLRCVILYHQRLYTNMYTTTLLVKEILKTLSCVIKWILASSVSALFTLWLCQITGYLPALNWLCTSSVPALYQLCTSSVPALYVYQICTNSLLALYQVCTGSVQDLYQLCIGSVSAL